MRRLFGKRNREVKPTITDRTNEQDGKRQATDERVGLGLEYLDAPKRQVAFVADDAQSIQAQHAALCFPPRSAAHTPRPPSPSLPVAQTRRPSEQPTLALPTLGPNGTLRATSAASSHPFPSYERPVSALSHRASTSMSVQSGPQADSPAGRSMSRLASAQGGYPGGMTRSSSSGQLQLPMTWSSMTEGDLVANLGARERTRQECLWEIVASEERCVFLLPAPSHALSYAQELLSLRDRYVEPLLHPYRSPPISPTLSRDGSDSVNASFDSSTLPIASRFARLDRSMTNDSTVSHRTFDGLDSPALPDISGEDSAFVHSQDPAALSRSMGMSSTRTRSHPAASSPALSSTPTRFRHHLKSANPPTKLHRSKASAPATLPPTLPQELRIVLEVIGDHLVTCHETLSLRLRERYTEQYPLVRDLASVFSQADWIVEWYSVFILHLEKALAAVDEALATVKAKKGVDKDLRRLAKTIMDLEERAALDGETGLAICLSKPFQRLTKYPLLFSTLLYHTDPSTAEFASTQAITIKIDEILRTIENEKIDHDHRLATRDVLARIEGITDRGLVLPNSDRVLIDETPTWQPPETRRSVSDAGRSLPQSSLDADAAQLRTKKSARRVSDFVIGVDSKPAEPSIGSKRDIWRIRFNDVTILCQRTGVTDVPIGQALETSKKRRLPGPRRNLYKYQRAETWEMKPLPGPPSRSLSDDTDLAETDEENEANSDGESKMSFIYGDNEDSSPARLTAALASTTVKSASRIDKYDRSGATSRAVKPAPSPILRTRSPAPPPAASRHRFDAPTASSRARSTHAIVNRSQTPDPQPVVKRAQTPELRPRTLSAASPSSSPNSRRRVASAQSTNESSPQTRAPRMMVRDNSSRLLDADSVGTYASFWKQQQSQR